MGDFHLLSFASLPGALCKGVNSVDLCLSDELPLCPRLCCKTPVRPPGQGNSPIIESDWPSLRIKIPNSVVVAESCSTFQDQKKFCNTFEGRADFRRTGSNRRS